MLLLSLEEGLNGVKRVAWNIQKINCVSWKREKINRVSWIIFVQITVLFVEGLNGVKRVAWNIQKINRVPCLLHPHWDPLRDILETIREVKSKWRESEVQVK